MYVFGSGALIGIPPGANPTPINLGLVQDVTYDETATLKELYGQNRRALAVGAGTIKTSVKAKMARISGKAWGQFFYGQAPVLGQTASVVGEAGTVPTTPFQVTVANSATWVTDLGVINAATGLPLTRVASAPITGQYSVTAGVYLFAAADVATAVLISYTYTVAATGANILVANPLLGITQSIQLNLYTVDPTTGLGLSLQIYNAVAEKLMFGTKLEDFAIPEIDFKCYVNGAGNLARWSFADAA